MEACLLERCFVEAGFLGLSGASLGLMGFPGASWELSGASWGSLELFWGLLGLAVASSWDLLGSWELLGPLGVSWGFLGFPGGFS